ncbi:MAG TPA: TolC family protein [Verrucomicrobia bacterium]|nr:TolC family protein [Verrucomicrobiota bacterium]HOP97335.1 TolC family protein [Verrucomicrobiota bacterium]HPU54816.1 TolC family protein [Verrucomicrobiota bacterium]
MSLFAVGEPVKTLQKRCGWLVPITLAAALSAGCTANHYRKSADKEAYRTLAEKAAAVPNMDPAFTIEQTNVLNLESLPVVTNAVEFLGADAEKEIGARVLSLEEALKIAVRHNRVFQSRKEQLYLSALSLTLARHQFTPIFSGRGSARVAGQTEQALSVVIDPDTGEPTVELSDNLVEQRRVSANGSLDVSWLMRDVGRITASFTTDFLRFITGDPRTVTSSQVAATFTRPLLRNAGFKQQIENLTQAERNLLYDIRDFVRFRKDFSVQVATAYYGVLGRRDAARNSYLNLQSSRRNAERTRALAQEGRVTIADLGRLEQQELSAEGAWVNAVRAYQESLDEFKLSQLGVPVTLNLILDDSELEKLTIRHPEIDIEDSINIALAARMDFMNAKDRLEDARRAVALARDALRPQLDLAANVGFNSPEQRNGQFAVPDPERYRWNAGLDVNLPFDRKAERNAYRSALIAELRAQRELEQQEDQIRLQVRESWRTLDQAKRNYEISEVGVQIAERRVEEQELLSEVGRARAQDQVDAQNALIDSRNQRTQALVTHTIARLQFWNNMGILYIKDNGQWQEVSDAATQ